MPGRWIQTGRARAFSATAGQKTMPVNAANDDPEKARRFRDAALPHLDDVYTLARYLLREPADAEDAVQECYLRALKHFDSYRGPAMKPWLLAILRNVCRAEFARRANAPAAAVDDCPRAPSKRRCGAKRRKRRRRRCCASATPPRSGGWWRARRTVPGDLRAA